MVTRGFITLQFSPELTFFVVFPAGWFLLRLLWSGEVRPLGALGAVALAGANLLLVLTFAHRQSVALAAMMAEFVSVVLLHLWVRRLKREELSLLLYYCCMLHYYLSRADWFHYRWLPVIASLLLPFLLLQARDKRLATMSEVRVLRGIAYATLAIALALSLSNEEIRPYLASTKNGARLLALRLRHLRATDSDLVLGSEPESPAWKTVYRDKNELAALRYLTARSGNGPLFVGVGDNSRIFFNDLRAYWLAGRPIGVRMFQLETRVATEAPVQKQLISDLERNGVRWLLLDERVHRGDDTFAAQEYRGATLLDDYVKSHFREAERFGPYSVMNRVL